MEDRIMYVSINMDDLVFVHKHADHDVVSAISWLEIGTHHSTVITATDKARFLKTLTPLELKMLYKNTTGGGLASDDPVVLRYQLADAVHLLHCTRAVADEVHAQVALVDDRVHAGETFKYAYGARVPAQPQELFPLRGRPLTAKELQDAADWAASDLPALTTRAPSGPWPKRVPEDVPPLPEGVEVVVPVEALVPEAPQGRQIHKPKRSDAKIVIRAEADAAWRAAGEPTDPQVLKTLWLGLLPTLTGDKGLHPTTCRIKLAEWAKERASQ